MGIFSVNSGVKVYPYTLQFASLEGDVCATTTSSDVAVYQSTTSLSFTDPLYSDAAASRYMDAGWYSDGFSRREWSGVGWLGSGTVACPQ